MASYINDSARIANDGILPSQLLPHQSDVSGERALLLELLTDAIECFKGGGAVGNDTAQPWRRERTAREARDWFLGFGSASLSCAFVCAHLGIDQATLIETLTRTAPYLCLTCGLRNEGCICGV